MKRALALLSSTFFYVGFFHTLHAGPRRVKISSFPGQKHFLEEHEGSALAVVFVVVFEVVLVVKFGQKIKFLELGRGLLTTSGTAPWQKTYWWYSIFGAGPFVEDLLGNM